MNYYETSMIDVDITSYPNIRCFRIVMKTFIALVTMLAKNQKLQMAVPLACRTCVLYRWL